MQYIIQSVVWILLFNNNNKKNIYIVEEIIPNEIFYLIGG